MEHYGFAFALGLRALGIIAGSIAIWLGYRLFSLGVFQAAGDLEGTWEGKGALVIKRAAPGTFFALFGAVIIAVCIWKEIGLHIKPVISTDVAMLIGKAVGGNPLNDQEKERVQLWLVSISSPGIQVIADGEASPTTREIPNPVLPIQRQSPRLDRSGTVQIGAVHDGNTQNNSNEPNGDAKVRIAGISSSFDRDGAGQKPASSSSIGGRINVGGDVDFKAKTGNVTASASGDASVAETNIGSVTGRSNNSMACSNIGVVGNLGCYKAPPPRATNQDLARSPQPPVSSASGSDNSKAPGSIPKTSIGSDSSTYIAGAHISRGDPDEVTNQCAERREGQCCIDIENNRCVLQKLPVHKGRCPPKYERENGMCRLFNDYAEDLSEDDPG